MHIWPYFLKGKEFLWLKKSTKKCLISTYYAQFQAQIIAQKKLRYTPKTPIIKKQIDKLAFNKIKNFCSSKNS